MSNARSKTTLAALLLAAILIASRSLAQDFGGFESAPPSGPTQTVAVVALGGYQKVMDDVKYVGGLLGMPDAAQMVEGSVAMVTQGKGLVGLDKSKPWGVIVRSSGMDISPIVCLPVSDLDGLLALGAPAGIVVDDMGEGVKSASMQGQTLYLKNQGEWAFAAQAAVLLTDLPGDPAAEFAELVTSHDIGIKLMAQKVPAMYKQMLLGGLTQGVEMSLEQMPGEDDKSFELRKKAGEINLQNIQDLVNGIDVANLGISVNPTGGGLAIDADVVALTNSPLAEKMGVYQSKGATRFAGFRSQDASLSFVAAYQASGAAKQRMIDQYEQQISLVRQMLLTAIREEEGLPNEAVKETFESIMEELLACAEGIVRSGESDQVGSMQLKLGDFSTLFAVAMPEPEKLDAALKKAAALAEDDANFPAITWAGEKHQGVDIHSVVVPVDDRELQQVVGGLVRIAVGIGPDAAYLSVGRDAVSELKKALDASVATGVASAKPIEVTISVGKLAEFAAAAAEVKGDDASVPQMIAQLLNGETSDSVRIVVDSGPDSISYKLLLEEGVLKAAGATATEMRGAMMPAF